MSNITYSIFNGKQGGTDPTTFIGRVGDVFYDPATGFLRLSDGTIPGGTLLNMIGRQGYCGVFYDTTVQTNDNTTNKIRFNTTDISDGVSVVANSRITLAHAGRYNIQFSLQLDKTDSGTDVIEIWLSKNGQDVENSGSIINLVGNVAKTIAAWNFVVDALANDYYELAWYTTDQDVRLHAQSGLAGNPNVPSAILTVTQV